MHGKDCDHWYLRNVRDSIVKKLGQAVIRQVRWPQFIKAPLTLFPPQIAGPWNFPGVRRMITAMFARGGYDSAYEHRQRS
ncbi:hypothetical protein AHiyo4_48360 [Arthrobacter sp. Hiyo4]|nr:hypothetical protein AHiyo4_48360 [Arthrobacter sp. Hiyo4]